jgi:hypothetical protein
VLISRELPFLMFTQLGFNHLRPFLSIVKLCFTEIQLLFISFIETFIGSARPGENAFFIVKFSGPIHVRIKLSWMHDLHCFNFIHLVLNKNRWNW